jgi:peptide/nickel transport system substrate-binding protein
MEMWKKILNYGTSLQLFLTAVDTPDPHTAVFRYERPMPLNLLLRALPDLGYISPKHVYEGSDIRQNPANTAPVGTGPYRFVQYERGQFIIAERNPNYWRNGMPYLDRVVWRVVSDRSAAAAQMEAGQILFSPYSSLTIADLQRLGRDPRFEVTTKGNEGNARNNTLEFNFRNPVLADIRVRRAIAHAIDVPFFIENFLGEFAKRGTGPIPSVSTDYYPGADAAIRLRPPPRERAAGRGRASARRRRRALQPAPDPGALGRGHRAVVHLHPAVAAGGGHPRRDRALDAAGFLRTVYNDWNFDLATGWHQYRNDPAVSTSVWYRSGQPKGAPWTTSGAGGSGGRPHHGCGADRAGHGAAQGALRRLRRRVNTELPLWMPIEQIFVSVFNRRLRNHANNPRWASSSWHDLWLASCRLMRVLALAGRRLAASLPTLVLILVGLFLLLQLAPGDTVDALMAQTGRRRGSRPAAELRPSTGLDLSVPAQLGNYLWRLVRLDLGFSSIYGKPGPRP